MVRDRLQSQTCAEKLKALAEPVRLQVIDLLRDGSRTVSEVAGALELELVNASHHLGILYRAGLVTRTRNGRHVVYALVDELLQRTSGDKPEHLDLGCCRLEIPKS
jgi:DNA-binding transcriptional ArsR family regulator